ncbi:type IX secretion system membrane protein, PorP/SprF family [Saccharicrinis carchari]|uniref:Type IX secretion system membrane protein, PorP/SprF family n=1 Tax=Saccharicrinis carchari TaxID=1168039 RepID=A0A521BX54_SACCC|nr:PorP/SprF family type IX secretion system membrane protein [Saccharicrinis carchari]SMO51792.1 type IX secretion system membrane protein, PorP/SprF family [Saccharicrinis carchari]
MKSLLAIFVLLGVFKVAEAQRYFVTNLYMYDIFLMNPAAAGIDKSCYNFGANYQNQWLGMDRAPTTQMLNFQGPLMQNMGMGTYMYNDRNGNMGQFGLHQSLSYEVVLKKSLRRVITMAFGLGVLLEQSRIDESNLNNHLGILDPAIGGGVTSGWGMNANSGVLFKLNDYQMGFSVSNMLGQLNPLYLNDGEPSLAMDFHLHLSSLYKVVNRDVYLEPLIMYRQNQNDDQRLDLTLKGTFPTPNPDYALWGVASYRRSMDHRLGKSLGLGTTLGVNYHSLSFGMEFQLGLTGAQLEYGSAYKLLVRYTICNNLKNKAIPCSEIRRNKRSRYDGLSW